MSSSLDQTPQGEEREDRAHKRKKELLELILLKSNTYAFVLVLLLIIIAGIVSWWLNDQSTIELWKVVMPAITAYLGYVFGSKDRDKTDPPPK